MHKGGLTMKRVSFLTLGFALLFTIFLLLLIFFRTPFPPYPLMSYQDAFDLLTPLVLIPIYWLLFRYSADGDSRLAEEIAFMVLAAIWVLGHGMHLVANSVNNLAESLAKGGSIDITRTDIYTLLYFLDEHLSHYLWHGGILGLAALLSYREWRRPTRFKIVWWATILAGFIQGFTYFCIILEGQTVPMGFPFVILFTLITLIWGRKKLDQRPLLTFFSAACVVALLLFAGWGLYWGGFPEFSAVGLI
jgi:hypothetical protein